jgi:Protein of unknown function (DUF3443)
VRNVFALMLIPAVLAAGCGGGGSSSNSGSGGGGGGGAPQTIATPGPPNVESLIVDSGPAVLTTPPNDTPSVNTAFISVQVCVPGSTTSCQRIDYIEVDTGSVGLRILGDALDHAGNPLTITLPAVTDGSGHPLAECLAFVDGFSWGSVNVADITLPVSTETAHSVNVQIIAQNPTAIGAPQPACVPPANSPLPEENTVLTFGANGILGVGPFINDCNSEGNCAPRTPPTAATYFSCTAPGTCTAFSASLQEQVPNPVTLFAKDNNGVIIELPAVPDTGAATLSPSTGNGGALVFGIGTENNNALGDASQVAANSGSGFISATLNGNPYPDSYLDSGSNGNFLTDSRLLPICPTASNPNPTSGFYCPSATVSENATLGTNMVAADFDVANADTLSLNTTYTAFNNLGGTNPDPASLVLGLPFFFGRNVFEGFETTTGAQPYFAYIAN